MASALTYFHKAGGKYLIKQYFRAGVLWTAIIQFLTLGRNKTALELLRLAVSLKINRKLEKKYKYVLDCFDSRHTDSLPHNANRVVWMFWWQGMENAPDLVKVCYKQANNHLGTNWKINLITKNNYSDYVNFPKHIEDKFKSGIITITHLSDLLRLELLIKYGGLWIDATVLCTGNEIPKSILESDLFVFQMQKPGADGRTSLMSSWLMYATTNNKILMATRDLLYEYWLKKEYMIDYFLLHHFFAIVCKRYSDDAKKIPPFCNSVPHVLQLHLFDQYNAIFWSDLKKTTCFHKLTYKLDVEKCKEKGTYFDMIINNRD